MKNESEQVVDAVVTRLSLSGAALGAEYFYNSLTFCAIDAVFSIGVRYEGVQNVVNRYCRHFGKVQFRPDPASVPDQGQQDSVSSFCRLFEEHGIEFMTNEVFASRQRTSTRSGILKSEAVWQFAQVLQKHGIEYLQDISKRLPSDALEKDIRALRGQSSGISLQYFWMLAGSDDLIKPDRMILRFLEGVLGRPVQVDEAQSLLTDASTRLKARFPQLTPRLLDYAVWEYQRAIASKKV